MKKKRKTFRPRLSLKMLLFLPLIVALYFPAAKLTQEKGIYDINARYKGTEYVAPFVTEKLDVQYKGSFDFGTGTSIGDSRMDVSLSYYGWFFGYVWKYPFSRTFSHELKDGQSFTDKIYEGTWGEHN